MAELIFKSAFALSILLEIVIRMPYNRIRQRTDVATDQVSATEKTLLGLMTLGIFFLPVIYLFTDWLSFADYHLPNWLGIVGIVLLGLGLWLFWRSHVDLGRNWSPSLQVMAGHTLVAEGVYRTIRHPMYASQMLLGLAQLLLLQNWIAGPAGLVLFLPLYLVRVPREEQMMSEQFGDDYRAYLARTNRILPRLGRG
jgi:protein-S-isoprenylcysteine O-methyltransferase Ste14